MKKRAISELKKNLLEAADRVHVLDSIKEAAQAELGQQTQKKIVSEVGKRSRLVEDIPQAAFLRLGVSAPPPPPKKRRKRRKKGGCYPAEITSQFGSGIALE